MSFCPICRTICLFNHEQIGVRSTRYLANKHRANKRCGASPSLARTTANGAPGASSALGSTAAVGSRLTQSVWITTGFGLLASTPGTTGCSHGSISSTPPPSVAAHPSSGLEALVGGADHRRCRPGRWRSQLCLLYRRRRWPQPQHSNQLHQPQQRPCRLVEA